MQLSDSDQQRNEEQFDSYMKTVLKNYSCDLHRRWKKQMERETLFADMAELRLKNNLLEECFDEIGSTFFVKDTPIRVKSDLLTAALRKLSGKKQEIILLFYFLGMTDGDIGAYLQKIQSTVQSMRSRTLKEMKKYMEEELNEKKKQGKSLAADSASQHD